MSGFALVLAAGLAGAAYSMVTGKEHPLGLALTLGAIAIFALSTWVFSLTGLADK